MKSKILFIIFIAILITSNVSLQAVPFSSSEHQEVIENSIERLTLIQNQIFAPEQKKLIPANAADSSVKLNLLQVTYPTNRLRVLFMYVSNK